MTVHDLPDRLKGDGDLRCVHCGRTGRQVYAAEGATAWLRLTLAIFLPSAGIYGEHVGAEPVDLCSEACLHGEIGVMLRDARTAGLTVSR